MDKELNIKLYESFLKGSEICMMPYDNEKRAHAMWAFTLFCAYNDIDSFHAYMSHYFNNPISNDYSPVLGKKEIYAFWINKQMDLHTPHLEKEVGQKIALFYKHIDGSSYPFEVFIYEILNVDRDRLGLLLRERFFCKFNGKTNRYEKTDNPNNKNWFQKLFLP